MNHSIRVVFFFFVCILINSRVRSQTHLGAGFGTFNVPGASMKFRGLGPTLRLEHIQENKRVSLYIDISYFEKALPAGTTELYNDNGIPIGSASVTNKFSYIYNQVGLKILLSADADEKKIIPYIGGGAAVVFARQRSSYQPSYDVSDDVHSSVLYGFHFNAGIQYNIKPVILELRGNLDIILKPLVDDNSNILTNLRLSATMPIFH